MQNRGLAEYNTAMADGRYEIASEMKIPDDFISEITKNKRAYDFYKTLNKTNLNAISWRLQTANTGALRLKRIKLIVEKLEKGEKFH